MAKKMSVAEILAAARAGKSAEASAPVESTPSAPPPEAPEAKAPASTDAEVPAPAPATPAPVAKSTKGMSMAEILAAARSGKPGAAPPKSEAKPVAEKAPAPKPVAEKPAPKPAAAAKPAAGTPVAKDTASILAAARSGSKPGPISKAEAIAKGQPVGEATGKKKIEVPPMPAKPDYARPKTDAPPQSRRAFMAATTAVLAFAFGSPLAIGFSSLVITHLMWVLGLARFMFPNILIEPPTRFKVGFPDGFSPGQVETKFIPQFGVWIVKYDYEGQSMIYALKSVCTHLGCTPNWLEAEQKFKCPCHGSGFYKDGINFEGPAPRPLERYAISLADDGQLLVDKSRQFNQELGQWNDPASYVPV